MDCSNLSKNSLRVARGRLNTRNNPSNCHHNLTPIGGQQQIHFATTQIPWIHSRLTMWNLVGHRRTSISCQGRSEGKQQELSIAPGFIKKQSSFSRIICFPTNTTYPLHRYQHRPRKAKAKANKATHDTESSNTTLTRQHEQRQRQRQRQSAYP